MIHMKHNLTWGTGSSLLMVLCRHWLSFPSQSSCSITWLQSFVTKATQIRWMRHFVVSSFPKMSTPHISHRLYAHCPESSKRLRNTVTSHKPLYRLYRRVLRCVIFS